MRQCGLFVSNGPRLTRDNFYRWVDDGWHHSVGGLWVEICLPPSPLLLRSQTTAVARRSYFTFSLAVKEDEVITVLEWQRGSEVKEGSGE